MKIKITIVFVLCSWVSTLLAQTSDKPLFDQYNLKPHMKHKLIDEQHTKPDGGSILLGRAYLSSGLQAKLLEPQTFWKENFAGNTIVEHNVEGDASKSNYFGIYNPTERLPILNEKTFIETPQTAWVQHYGSGLKHSYDYATKIAVDNAGYIYVTGTSTKLPFGTDYLTIKYSSAGDTIWTQRYDGSGEGDDIPIDIAVDGSGNVFITGVSKGLGTSDDYVTIKYDANGNHLWDAHYNGTENATDDVPTDLVIDDSGNVYVTGRSEDLMRNWNYATIKYDASGNQLWVARYGDQGNHVSGAIDLDDSGNVYVSGGGEGLVTIKYDTNGNQQWVAQHSGSSALKAELVVDGYSNVYVTGSSYNSVSSFDYVTIKYDVNGNQLWVASYNVPGIDEPTALDVDVSGNVYVTGYCYNEGSYDIATIKYDASGNQLWVARHSGGMFYHALAVDGSGNAYVTGFLDNAYVIIKYDTNGNQLWVGPWSRYSDISWKIDLALDDAGNVYVTGGSYTPVTNYDYATTKYDTNGNQIWAARYNGLGTSNDYPEALAIDGTGSVYVAGYSYGPGEVTDYATIKYDDGGNKLWVAKYNGPANDYDVATALAINATGNVYVTGGITVTAIDWDYTTIKYDPNGNQLWVARYNGLSSTNSYDKATSLAIDGSGNVYVTGYSSGSGTNYDYATIKYDASGNQLWVARYNCANFNDVPKDLVVDASGNVYVTGYSFGSEIESDYATIKYDASGNQLWVARYNGENFNDSPNDLAIDGLGNVYVTGESKGSGTDFDYATIKYDASGNQLWVARYNGPRGNESDYATALAVGESGNVYITGKSFGAAWVDYATIKYDASGNEIWVARYSSNLGSFSTDFAVALVLDGSSNVYVTGRSSGTGRYDFDYATIKYNASGNEMWIARYNVTKEHHGQWSTEFSGDWEVAKILAVDESGKVYIAARSGGNGWSVFTTIKYIQQPSSVNEIPPMPKEYSLEQNYPNPFNPSTVINFSLPKEANISLVIFDLLGREVAILVSEKLPAGTYTRQWNAEGLSSGVYFCRLQAGAEFVQTKKLLLLR